MGYEYMGTYERECYCGNGKIEETTEMDDWNRTKTTTTIHCKTCKQEEENKKMKLNDEERERRLLRKETKESFMREYFEIWDNCLNNYRTKKEKYKFMSNNNIIGQSIVIKPSLINKYKKDDISEKILDPQVMIRILAALEIEDDSLVQKLERLIELDKKSFNRALQAYHRG